MTEQLLEMPPHLRFHVLRFIDSISPIKFFPPSVQRTLNVLEVIDVIFGSQGEREKSSDFLALVGKGSLPICR